MPPSASGSPTTAASRSSSRRGSTYDHLPQALLSRNEDEIADIFVHEIENGYQGTGIKAAFHQVRGRRAWSDAERREGPPCRRAGMFRTASRSWPTRAQQAGPARSRCASSRRGVEPDKVQVAHTGDSDDLDYIERLLETGCWIGMDRYGIDIYLPTDRRNATMLALLERGYADRMFISRTTARRSTGSRARSRST